MRPARLAVTAQQNFIVGLQKQNRNVYSLLLEFFVNSRKHIEELSRAYVDHESRPLYFSRVITQANECRDQLGRKIVDREVAKIFKVFKRRGHPRPRDAGNDNDRSRHKE